VLKVDFTPDITIFSMIADDFVSIRLFVIVCFTKSSGLMLSGASLGRLIDGSDPIVYIVTG
jgi:hypothetical protein